MASLEVIFRDRLRRPASPSTVPGSLPVLFFGDPFGALVATVGINPSKREFLGRDGRELDGIARRFETLGSLGAEDRASLSDQQCALAIERMRTYYQPGKPVYSWFRSLERVLGAMGVSYTAGEAAHLELVQESTDPTWTELQRSAPAEAGALLATDAAFLRGQLEALPLHTIVCNGRTVLDGVGRLLDVDPIAAGTLARVNWSVGAAVVAGRPVVVAGWNIPLARPTGLGVEGERLLGATLADAIRTILSDEQAGHSARRNGPGLA